MAKITFLGTGTSQGVPVISCGCWVCTSDDKRDNRLRASAMIELYGKTIVIDAGPDFRQQMLRHNVKHIDGILLTHEHKDHIGGIDDVRAFNYTSQRAVKIYAEPRVQKVIRKDFDYAFAEDKYPGAPDIDLITIEENTPFNIDGVDIIPIRGKHYKLPVLGFRIGDIAYLTDFKTIDDHEIAKLKGVRVLIINALRKESHISHFTLSEALEVSYKVGARDTFLTHVSHQMGRHSMIDNELPAHIYFAYDGLVINTDNE